MKSTPFRFSKEEFALRGEHIFDREIQPFLAPEENGKFCAIDIETKAHEIDHDDYTATEKLLERVPGAQIWLIRIGKPTAYQILRLRRGTSMDCNGMAHPD